MEDDLAAIRDLAVRWLDAVSASDVGVLSQLMTDDVVVIHGNGRVLAGREAVVADFISTFNTLRVIQILRREEMILAGGRGPSTGRECTRLPRIFGTERRGSATPTR
jgi:ketosteroid isomerase-like protein